MTQEIQHSLGSTGFYDKRGEDAVLLIHGLTGTPAEMRYIAKNLLKQGFSVACPQLAGHCGSVADLKRSTWQDWYASMEVSFEALKKEHKRVFVSGLSMGALIAIKLAEEKGERPRRLDRGQHSQPQEVQDLGDPDWTERITDA